MYSHLKSDIYHLKSRIALTAESRLLTACFAAVQPSSLFLLGVLALLAIRFRICIASPAPHSLIAAAIAQIAVAAAMSEPTASLGGSSRASRIAMTLFQRLLPCFPSAIAAETLS